MACLYKEWHEYMYLMPLLPNMPSCILVRQKPVWFSTSRDTLDLCPFDLSMQSNTYVATMLNTVTVL